MRSRLPASPWIAAPVCLLGGAALALLVAGGPAPSSAAEAPPPAAPPPRASPATMTLVAGGDVALAGEPNGATFARSRRLLPPAEHPAAGQKGGSSRRCRRRVHARRG